MSISGLFAREEKPDCCDSDVGASEDAVSRDVVDMVEYVDTEYSEDFEDDVRDEVRDDVREEVRDDVRDDVCEEALEGWADGNGDGEECGSDGMTSSSGSTVPSSTRHDDEYEASDVDLEDIIAQLDDLCREENASCPPHLDIDEEVADGKQYRDVAAALRADEPGMDTSVLERIRNADGSSDRVFDDLLAPLRLEPLLLETEESEEHMLDVILTWNKRIADQRNSDSTERQAFVAALRERVKVVDQILAIVSDNRNSNQDNETGQNGILEPSQRQLLKAIHAYRPETKGFKTQDPFNMLIIMLAHIRQKEFELANKDDGIYLALKVLSGQEQLEHRFDREKKRRAYQRNKKNAEEDENREEVKRCETKWRAYNRKPAERARQGLMAKIQCAQNELRKAGIDELLGLAVLRSAQPRASREAHPSVYTPSLEEIMDKCTQADDYDNLDHEFAEQFPHLETKLEVTSNNAQDMKTVHDTALFRMAKLAGADLKGLDKDERKKVMTARLNDPVTATVIEETLKGVTDTRRAAKQMLEQLGLIGQPMRELLEAVTAKRDDLIELTRLINREECPDTSNEIQEGE
ncbi:hypothetical protein J4E86_009398 [Alternaria arbusti]|uniref:uncharacterized protein n=1 Tax=Alternaria arbusti TaxID=232088 RepID=UPI0022200379|nr:uncharacterized protein J4E86_009398 [Alternaria arbusti]KAI4944340.1 hypothetical protein J4E86_009398 [Alternaria arbusti]